MIILKEHIDSAIIGMALCGADLIEIAESVDISVFYVKATLTKYETKSGYKFRQVELYRQQGMGEKPDKTSTGW